MRAAKLSEDLLQYATAAQAKCIRAVIDNGGMRGASRALGMNYSTIHGAIAAVQKKAALAGYAPAHDMTKVVPDPFVVRGTSTLYDGDGKLRLQWVKTKLSEEKFAEVLKDWVDWLVEDARGIAPVVKPPARVDADLLAVYPMGDPHFGMYAWAAEAGEDFDTDICERLTLAAIDRLVASAPPAETAVIIELGDFFHTDNSTNVTLRSHAALDVDTRWARVMQIGLRAMVHAVKRALAKHKRVVVRIVKGNHDPHASFALALALDAYFDKEPRVEIDLSPAVHWYFRFGKVLLGATHGDTTKIRDLPGVMACDRPNDWGEAVHRYWYCGHVHHVEQREFPGVLVEYFRTLAARDAWHAGQGYRAGRDMRLIVHHREFGEIERHRCDVAMLQS